jgi:hypothetical protein
MRYWLFKSEPSTWSWDDQVAKGETGEEWDGVRNYQARNFMREMAVGDRYVGRSIIGGRFDCRVAAAASVGDRSAIVPTIRGRAWITGTHQIMRDPADPWPQGYRVGDTWPNGA